MNDYTPNPSNSDQTSARDIPNRPTGRLSKTSLSLLLMVMALAAGEAVADPAYPVDSNGLPRLHSNPGAAGTVYLNFTGGQWLEVDYPPFGGDDVYDAVEQDKIYRAWVDTSAIYAMFDLNVTTVEPDYHTTPTAHILISRGTGTKAKPNTYGRTTGQVYASASEGVETNRTAAIGHEVGHMFGLTHQAEYDDEGTLIAAYRAADEWNRGALMGEDIDCKFAGWTTGPTPEGPTVVQDDIAVIAEKIIEKANLFTGGNYTGDGFRPDDHGNAMGTATEVFDAEVAGIIERRSDVDMFRLPWRGGAFTVSAEAARLQGGSIEYASSVGLDMHLYDSSGTLIASDLADDPADVYVELNLDLLAGTYFVSLESHGDYEDLGAYTLSLPLPSPLAPTITGTPVDPIPEVSGYYVYGFTVADADTLPADLTFQLTDNRFTVSEDGAGGYRVHRLISHRFDYETLQDYDFDLVVSDGVEEDRVNIAFSLVNINDNAPVVSFTSAGPITENDPGAVLGVIDVSDPDGDTTFYYDFDTRFELAADGRTLKLKDGVALDYETETSLPVGIIVSDGPLSDGDANQAGVDATIPVLNVNDVAPSNIQLSGLEVSENDPGAVVGTLSAVDADGPSLGFSVSDTRFEVQGNQLKLVDGVALDREATPSVTLTVTASDGTFDDSRNFTITVLNIDEGAPENIALSNASIDENTTGVLGELSATDVDGDAIIFSVTDGRFAVSGSILELATAINHESLAEGTVALEVTASGGGASTTETFLITIEDVNEAPTMLLMADTIPLNGNNHSLPVLENTRQATVAGSADPGETQYPLSFQANDVDEDLLTWVLTGADAAAFTVDAATGALNFVTPADFENPADADGDGVYEVTVAVTDGELASNTVTLTLTILDTVDEPYDTWATDHGLTPGVNDDPEDDPDGDGCPNWREFAFDGNPLSGTKSGKKRLGMVMVEDVEHLALTIPVRSGAVFSGSPSATATVDGIGYTIQGTSDLQDWTLPVTEVVPADSVGLPALNDGWEYRTFVVDASRQNAFLRIGLQSGF